MGNTKILGFLVCGLGCGIITVVAFSQSIVANPLGIKDLDMFALGIFFAFQTFLDFHSVFTDE